MGRFSFSEWTTYLPSLSLPSIPFPSLTLPQNIQKRLLSFLLRRSVGTFVKGGLDANTLDADLSTGCVRLHNVELDEEAVAPFLEGLPLRFDVGKIDLVIAQVSWPLSLASKVDLDVAHLSLVFSVKKTSESLSSSAFTLRSGSSPPTTGDFSSARANHSEVVDSVLSIAVASDFVREQMTENPQEAEQLLDSLHLTQSHASLPEMVPPGAFLDNVHQFSSSSSASDDDSPELNILASVIERILARLTVKIQDITVLLKWEEEGDEGAKVELKLEIKLIAFSRENYLKNQEPTGSPSSPYATAESARCITVTSTEVSLMLCKPDQSSAPAYATQSFRNSWSTDSSSSSSSEKVRPEHDMMMSQSIADLRSSTANEVSFTYAESASSVSPSLYASARSSRGFSSSPGVKDERNSTAHDRTAADTELSKADVADPFLDPDEYEGNLEQLSIAKQSSFTTILSFGADPIRINLSNTVNLERQKSQADDEANDRPVLSRTGVKVESIITDPLTLLILPHHLSLLAQLLGVFCSPDSPTVVPGKSLSQKRSKDNTLSISVNVKTINMVLVYEMDNDSLTKLSSASMATFWSHPTSTLLPSAHLRLRLDSCELLALGASSHSSVVYKMRSLSLTEHAHLYLNDTELSAIPLLVSDPDVGKQYRVDLRKDTLPAFESGDWLDAKSSESRGWKVRAKGRKLPGAAGYSTGAIQSAIKLDIQNSYTQLDLAPFHAFVDLSFLERMSPFLCFISSTFSALVSSPRSSSTSRFGLSETGAPSFTELEKGNCLILNIEMLRVDLRCPSPKQLATIGQSVQIRSGIATLDIHDLSVQRRASNSIFAECSTAFVFFLPAAAVRSIAIVCVSAHSRELVQSQRVSLPCVHVSQDGSVTRLSASTDSIGAGVSSTTVISCRLPDVRTVLDKACLDGVQLLADDVTQWSSRWLNTKDEGDEGHDGYPEAKNPKILGSRYFGRKSFSIGRKGLGSESEESSVDGASTTSLRIVIEKVRADLLVPQASFNESVPKVRQLQLFISDLAANFDVLPNSKNNLTAEIKVAGLTLEERSQNGALTIFSRTGPQLSTPSLTPVLQVSFTSSVENGTGLKESKVQIVVVNFTYHVTSDLQWVQDVTLFAKSPEGAFETVVPNELTRVRLRLVDGSVHMKGETGPTQLVLSLSDVKIATNIMPDMPRTLTSVEIQSVRALVISGEEDGHESVEQPADGFEYWKSLGFVVLADLQQAMLHLRCGNGLVLPDIDLQISDAVLRLLLCADSATALTSFFSNMSKSPSSESPQLSLKKGKSQGSGSVFMSGSATKHALTGVDSVAFEGNEALHDTLENVDDDVPTNTSYLSYNLKPTARQARPRSVLNRREDQRSQIISEIDGETIRMLDPQGLQVVDHFLCSPRTDYEKNSDSYIASIQRIRVDGCTFSIRLYEGYDWWATRRKIEDEAKALRRRLEKIRQLLASGQASDATVDEASIFVFGSIHLGLPPGASALPPNLLIAAIDEELEASRVDDGASSANEWHTVPGQGSQVPVNAGKPASGGKRRQRLTRSKSHAMEIKLEDVTASYDTFPKLHETASRFLLQMDTFEIIDNLRTSTWKKFLTELRLSDGGMVRPSESSMVRIELRNIRPAIQSSRQQQEIVLKIKIFPVRLYIDQDALDFLRAFAGFKAPIDATSKNVSDTKDEPFFQRVEVLPVKIKLDYKPKRVDYGALRQGRGGELMNFFHFDGSVMTLRHLVVTGIAGVARLSELVQDIWTPDVKANQLGDVISGIAPMRSVVNVGTGVANLVLLPIEQYRKDGRMVRGLQKGASVFARQTTLEALNVGARLATGTQVLLEQAEAVLGSKFSADTTAEALNLAGVTGDFPGSGTSLSDEERVELISRYAEQPNDLREGIELAYRSLGSNFRSAAQTVLAVPMEVYERSGTEGPVKAVIRAVPIAVLKPMIGASEAVSKALFGLRNTLDPEAQTEASDKYKSRSA